MRTSTRWRDRCHAVERVSNKRVTPTSLMRSQMMTSSLDPSRRSCASAYLGGWPSRWIAECGVLSPSHAMGQQRPSPTPPSLPPSPPLSHPNPLLSLPPHLLRLPLLPLPLSPSACRHCIQSLFDLGSESSFRIAALISKCRD